MQRKLRVIRTFWAGLLLLWSSVGAAQAGGQEPSFYLDTQFGLMTYKSKLVNSNDTGTALRYGVGSSAGSEGQLRFQLMMDTQTTSFALNDSKVAMSWQDTSIRYQWGFVYLGAVFSRLELTTKITGQEVIDSAGSGVGGVLGFTTKVGKYTRLGLDVSSASLPKMKNSLSGEVAVPSRLDVDLGAKVDLSKKFAFTFGYRSRTLQIKTESTYSEAMTSTYLGLGYSLYF